MIDFNVFSRLKYLFSRLNHISSFEWSDYDEEFIPSQSSKVLLENAIKKYPKFKCVILVARYSEGIIMMTPKSVNICPISV